MGDHGLSGRIAISCSCSCASWQPEALLFERPYGRYFLGKSLWLNCDRTIVPLYIPIMCSGQLHPESLKHAHFLMFLDGMDSPRYFPFFVASVTPQLATLPATPHPFCLPSENFENRFLVGMLSRCTATPPGTHSTWGWPRKCTPLGSLGSSNSAGKFETQAPDSMHREQVLLQC